MAKISKEEQARREGMAYALRIAKEKGIEELEKDLQMRRIFDLPVALNKSDLKAVDKTMAQFILLECLVTLRDRFGFGRKRAVKFKECFDAKCELIIEDWTSWSEQAQIVYEELGITFPEEIKKRFEERSGETR